MRTEIGISIVFAKDNKVYYQEATEFTFFPCKKCPLTCTKTISFVRIEEQTAFEIIESLNLEKTESDLYTKYIGKLHKKENAYLKKYSLNLELHKNQ